MGGADPDHESKQQEYIDMAQQELLKALCDPPVILEKDQYRIKFAVSEEEIQEALKLRYKVFCLEQGKNVKDFESGIDKDQFDDNCAHLVVEEKTTSRIVGTYRVHPGPLAVESHLGFYSAQEFRIHGLEKVQMQTIEVGRSCVDPQYRNGTVVALLWAGVSDIMRRSGLRYLMGCPSLEESDPAAGWLLYDYFKEQGKLCEEVFSDALPHVKMERPSPDELERFRESHPNIRKLLPPLFKGYLSMGAKICSEPVYDREFGAIDFLILLDVGKLPERYQKHFNVPVIQ